MTVASSGNHFLGYLDTVEAPVKRCTRGRAISGGLSTRYIAQVALGNHC